MTLKGHKNHYNVKLLRGYGVAISLKDSKITLRDGKDVLTGVSDTEEWFVTRMPYEKIVISGKGYVSTDAIKLLSEKNVNVILTDTYGNPVSSMNGVMSSWTSTRYRMGQYDTFRDPVKIQHLRDSDIRSILFSRGVVLVEGPSDKLVIEKIDKHLSITNKGANIEDNDWMIVDIGGKDSLPIFINLCKKLELPHLSIMDYDALMYCGKTIKKDNAEIKTSSIPFYVHLTSGITQKEFTNLKRLTKFILTYEVQKMKGDKTFKVKQSWYDKKCLNLLSKLAESHNIFVWTSDLEGVLQTHLTHKDSKPLKAFDTMYEKISKNDIPKEFNTMSDYIKKTIVKIRT